MITLKQETIEILYAHNKCPDDIVWIGISGEDDVEDYKYNNIPCEMPQELFWKIADRVYDDGFGSHIVPLNLKIVGDNWWLERHEYDGSEWWEFKTLPTRPSNIRNPFVPTQNLYNTWYLEEE